MYECVWKWDIQYYPKLTMLTERMMFTNILLLGAIFLNTNPIELHDMNQSNESHVMEE